MRDQTYYYQLSSLQPYRLVLNSSTAHHHYSSSLYTTYDAYHDANEEHQRELSYFSCHLFSLDLLYLIF